jgi:enoyl-CoA hydratase/carnithine racemase
MIKNHEEALELALFLSIVAPDDKRSEQAQNLAQSLIDEMKTDVVAKVVKRVEKQLKDMRNE